MGGVLLGRQVQQYDGLDAGGSVTTRGTGCGTSSARICSAVADSNGKVPAVYGGVAASVDAPSSAATMWSIVLPTAPGGPPPNQAPEAGFTSSCAVLGCVFDSSSSSDPENALATYAWTFGDGETSADASPSHTYQSAGTYDVTLTVTDAGGLSDSTTHAVTVDAVAAPIEFAGSAAAATSTAQAGVVVPATVRAGDRLVLVLSVNSTAPTFADPAGWTRLGTAVAKTMSTTVWTRVAGPADAGATVRVVLSAAAKSTLTVAAYRGTSPSTAARLRERDPGHRRHRAAGSRGHRPCGLLGAVELGGQVQHDHGLVDDAGRLAPGAVRLGKRPGVQPGGRLGRSGVGLLRPGRGQHGRPVGHGDDVVGGAGAVTGRRQRSSASSVAARSAPSVSTGR